MAKKTKYPKNFKEVAAKRGNFKVPVTTRALIQRINRALEKDGEKLKVTRGERARLELGDYYVVDLSRGFVMAKHCEPESLGRELNVLKDFEELVAE